MYQWLISTTQNTIGDKRERSAHLQTMSRGNKHLHTVANFTVSARTPSLYRTTGILGWFGYDEMWQQHSRSENYYIVHKNKHYKLPDTKQQIPETNGWHSVVWTRYENGYTWRSPKDPHPKLSTQNGPEGGCLSSFYGYHCLVETRNKWLNGVNARFLAPSAVSGSRDLTSTAAAGSKGPVLST